MHFTRIAQVCVVLLQVSALFGLENPDEGKFVEFQRVTSTPTPDETTTTRFMPVAPTTTTETTSTTEPASTTEPDDDVPEFEKSILKTLQMPFLNKLPNNIKSIAIIEFDTQNSTNSTNDIQFVMTPMETSKPEVQRTKRALINKSMVNGAVSAFISSLGKKKSKDASLKKLRGKRDSGSYQQSGVPQRVLSSSSSYSAQMTQKSHSEQSSVPRIQTFTQPQPQPRITTFEESSYSGFSQPKPQPQIQPQPQPQIALKNEPTSGPLRDPVADLPNTCEIGTVEPVWEGVEITETYCRCPDNSYGVTCRENFVNPCSGDNEQQYFEADSFFSNRYFIECNWGTPYLFKCPSDLVWNQQELTCDWEFSQKTDSSSSSSNGGNQYGNYQTPTPFSRQDSYQFQPEPVPQPTPQPRPQPTQPVFQQDSYQFQPQPVPQPTPQPRPQPTQPVFQQDSYQFQPQPVPQPRPQPRPQPTQPVFQQDSYQFQPQPVPQPRPQPTQPQPVPQPTPQPRPQPTQPVFQQDSYQFQPQPVPQPTPQLRPQDNSNQLSPQQPTYASYAQGGY